MAAHSDSVLDVTWLRQGLHSYPDILRAEIQREIDRAESPPEAPLDLTLPPEDYSAVILGFGLCSGAVCGLRSQRLPLVIPRSHDCIGILLGSHERYMKEFAAAPGTYWFSPGWIEQSTFPCGEQCRLMRERLAARYGGENAEYLMKVKIDSLQAYKRAALIRWPKLDRPQYLKRLFEIADDFGWQVSCIDGEAELLRRILDGEWNNEDTVICPPGQTVEISENAGIMRIVSTIEVRQGRHSHRVAAPPPDQHEPPTVLSLLASDHRFTIPAPCGGMARCGNCAVLIPDNPPSPSDADLRLLGRARTERGYRLACSCPVDGISTVVVPEHGRRAFVKGEAPTFDSPATVWSVAAAEGRYAVAVDVGTTTVAAYLFDTSTGAVPAVLAEINRQAVHGADVLSRIAYCDGDDARPAQMTAVIRAQLYDMISDFRSAFGRPGTAVVTGNTVMLHFLAGVSPAGIGRAPFTPEFTQTYTLRPDTFHDSTTGRVVLLPSISGYVGADIVCGALAAGMDSDDRSTLLLDVGTNGELALRHKGRVFVCSTAAGPAFEGATVSAGVGGIPGAISAWTRKGPQLVYETVGGEPAIGMCGSGLLDFLALALSDGVLDETGRMARTDEEMRSTGAEARAAWAGRLGEREGAPACKLAGDLRLTQKDVREVQSAKAAIAAGIDALCDLAGLLPGKIERVVLTGGFGDHLRVESALRIGLLPPLPSARFDILRDAAGLGALLALRQEGALERMEKLASQAVHLELSGHTLFRDRYVEHMTFPARS